MHKNLNLQTRNRGNLSNLLNRQLASYNNTLETQFLRATSALDIVNRQLRRRMQHKLRIPRLHQLQQSPILNNQTVRTHVAQGRQRVHQPTQLALTNQGVDSNINRTATTTPLMRMTQQSTQVVIRKILRITTSGKLTQTQVHRISPVGKCRYCRLQIARRRQKFHSPIYS